MKVLFASATHCDWIASTLWQGLIEVLGQESVFDATGGDRSLPGSQCHTTSTLENPRGPETGFDLLVLNSIFLVEHDWNWAVGHLGQETMGHLGGRLKAGAKIILVEGHDGANDIHPPPFPVDAVFRREIDPLIAYPYDCQSIDFALPQRLFDLGDHNRPFDLACVMNAKGMPHRETALAEARRLHGRFAVTAGEGYPHDQYMQALRLSKFVLCVPGAADCGDCIRNAEAVAMGAIPIFVADPPRIKVPWFDSTTAVWCPAFRWHSIVSELEPLLAGVLRGDVLAKRRRLQAYGLEHHCTAAMARRLLRSVGL